MLTVIERPRVAAPGPVVRAGRHRLAPLRTRGLIEQARAQGVALVCVAGAVAVWSVGFADADPLEMGQLGLLSLFNSATVVALILLLGSCLVCIYQRRPGWLIGTHLVAYLALIHGTPAVLYGSVRYAWSYKHLGVVDYIQRTGHVDPDAVVNPIYHNWPGMFAASAFLADVGGQGAAVALAMWAPLGFNLILLVVLRYTLRGFTGRAVVVWLALLFYFTTVWVGQDYFSPQAVANILYIAVVGLIVRNRYGSPFRTVVFVLMVAALAMSHQVTLLIMLMAVTALVVLRRTHGWYLPVLAGAIVLGWALTFAGGYSMENIEALIEGFGQPLSNAEATLEKSEAAAGLQHLVVWGDRFTVVVAVALALVGAWRTYRQGTLQWTAVILVLSPAAVVMQMSFGGEVLLRAYLFAAPFIAFLAAEACAPHSASGGFDRRRFWVAVGAILLVLPGFLLGYYGKERQNYFTSGELAASEWVSENALPGSLLVEGDTNYPRQFRHYEKFAYVPIAREPTSDRIIADPAQTLHGWLTNARYTEGYVVITRSQTIGVEMGGSMPSGSLTHIEESLKASPLFVVVFQNPDAVVFTLSDLGRRR